ncbi:alpha/beta fold hydrolase [Bacillus cihuensis]|uniref:alpha/beta fold hydrolase n=1 Tax=Bacillus cihuensis TaxID=1208599 RepID=UPI00041D284C|nr:alpha/beta hydrolase [Bacillus cihuensis]
MIDLTVETKSEIELYCECIRYDADAPTLVLLHGFLSSSFSFRKLTPFFKGDYNILAIDYPPFGKSEKSSSYTYSYHNVACSVINFLETRNLKKVILIGHSMGGQLCLQICKRRPDLVEKAVLLSGSSYLAPMRPSVRTATYLPFFPLLIRWYLGKSGIEKNLHNVVYDKKMIDDEMRNGYLEPFLQKGMFQALGRMARHFEGDLSEDDLQVINTDCLLIWGEHDQVVPLSIGKRLQKDLPHAQLIILKEAGHLIPEEKPEEVYNYIHDFLRK